MGRGKAFTAQSSVSLAGRYDLMPEGAPEFTASGKPRALHIADVKHARLAMIELLSHDFGHGLTTAELRGKAVVNGASEDEVVAAQVQLIRQHVIVSSHDHERWFLAADQDLVDEWRELSRP